MSSIQMHCEDRELSTSDSSSRNFQKWWNKEYGMIKRGTKAVCVICLKGVVCRTSSVKRHYETIHKSLLEKSKDEQLLFIAKMLQKYKRSRSSQMHNSSQSNESDSSLNSSPDNTVKNEKLCSDEEPMETVWLESNINTLQKFECEEEVVENKNDALLTINNTVNCRKIGIAKIILQQQYAEVRSADFISLCLDESIDVTGMARLAIFVRYCHENNVKEELISLTSLENSKNGIDICKTVIYTLRQLKIDLSKIVSVTTDGSHNMIEEANGFIDLFSEQVGHSVLGFHFIIHQQVVCAKRDFETLEEIMTIITQVVNSISSHGFSTPKFSDLLNEVIIGYNGLLLYNNVRWLCRGKFLQKFISCLDEVRQFLDNEKNIEVCYQLIDPEWLSKLMFFTDLCFHLNELNAKLQSVNKTIIIMYDLIKTFEIKLKIFDGDVISNNFKYFPNTKKIFAEKTLNKTELTQEFSAIIQSIEKEFCSKFVQFRKLEKTLKFILYPDIVSLNSFDLQCFGWLDLDDIEIQLTEFQCSTMWTHKFIELRNIVEIIEFNRLSNIIEKNPEEEIRKTWIRIPEKFSCLKKLAAAILTTFSSTYACESLFSNTNFVKCESENDTVDKSS